jgi:serine/threonine protein kinase
MIELSKESRADFIREVELMERLRSPFINGFLGAVVTPRRMWLVSEFTALGSLDRVMARLNLTARQRLACIADIGKGINFLHTSDILHRDLKPGNVLVFDLHVDAPVRCKLTDFGTSRAVAANVKTEITMTKGLGTPLYMAPECLSGSSRYTTAADVYSFAIMSLEIWTGSLPFAEQDFATPYALAMHVLGGHRPIIPQDCHPGIATLVTTNWAADPATRQCECCCVWSFSRLFQWASITLTLINNDHHHHFTAIKTIVATVDKLLQAQQEADADEEEVTGKIREAATPKHTTKTQTTGTTATSTTTTTSVTSTLVMA